jgi:DNA repair protein RecO (recombination protein O)
MRAEAIVIKRIDFGEADKILTLYTPFGGKVHAIAKGVRRPTSKLGGHVELFIHSQVLLAKGRNLDIVTQSETINAFRGLREDLRRTGYACYVAELLDRLTEHEGESHATFTLLLDTLRRLDEGRGPEMAVRLFEMQLLGFLGYRPQLYHCVQCRVKLGPTANFFSAPAGGALCFDCGHAQPTARAMTANAFKILRLLQSGDYATASRLRVDERLSQELEGIIRSHVTYVLEGDLKSVAVLRSMAASARPVAAGNGSPPAAGHPVAEAP